MRAVNLGAYDRGLTLYESALRVAPGHPHARFGRATSLLRAGRYGEGWLEYEWRWRTGSLTRPVFPRPRWDGSSVAGRQILVHTEQGIGDAIQLVRFLPRLTAQGASVVVACPARLRPLLARTHGIDRWFPIDQPAPADFDVFVPLASLPGLLGIDESTIPSAVPYVFPEPERVARWAPRIGALPGVRVGIAWQGSRTFVGDAYRSIPLACFGPLARVDGVRLVSLQRLDGEEDVARHPELGITVLPDLDRDGGVMMDTAAVMQHLDLVITSDTAIAHLAGAMGVPVWVALSTSSDWRWLTARADSPWYPSMRLFRQAVLGDWGGVFTEMADALRGVVEGDAPVMPARLRACSTDVPVGAGELFDKISILQIKLSRIADPAKAALVRAELDALRSVQRATAPVTDALRPLLSGLDEVNVALWDLEDAVRDCERRGEFGPEFVECARAIYRTNDRRAKLKWEINLLLGSALAEVKSYPLDAADSAI